MWVFGLNVGTTEVANIGLCDQGTQGVWVADVTDTLQWKYLVFCNFHSATSLVDLLQTGRVLLDGVDTRSVGLSTLRGGRSGDSAGGFDYRWFMIRQHGHFERIFFKMQQYFSFSKMLCNIFGKKGQLHFFFLLASIGVFSSLLLLIISTVTGSQYESNCICTRHMHQWFYISILHLKHEVFHDVFAELDSSNNFCTLTSRSDRSGATGEWDAAAKTRNTKYKPHKDIQIT